MWEWKKGRKLATARGHTDKVTELLEGLLHQLNTPGVRHPVQPLHIRGVGHMWRQAY